MTANELVAKIQEMNVDVGSADDVEKLKAAVGADSQSTEEFQELAWRALADCTASVFASKAKEMGLDLNNNDDVTKLCAELGETNLTTEEVQAIALNAMEQAGGELSDASLDGVAGGASLASGFGGYSFAGGKFSFSGGRAVDVQKFNLRTRNFDTNIGGGAMMAGSANHRYT
tara:strand:+ start:262 stop:780 length:519 start_codon:yes stop_codon:yes gene_type:complete